jgi:hypothetical protein
VLLFPWHFETLCDIPSQSGPSRIHSCHLMYDTHKGSPGQPLFMSLSVCEYSFYCVMPWRHNASPRPPSVPHNQASAEGSCVTQVTSPSSCSLPPMIGWSQGTKAGSCHPMPASELLLEAKTFAKIHCSPAALAALLPGLAFHRCLSVSDAQRTRTGPGTRWALNGFSMNTTHHLL